MPGQNNCGYNEFLYVFLGCILFLTIGIGIVNYLGRVKQHLLRKEEIIDGITQMLKGDTRAIEFFSAYANRQFDYIRVYFIFQSVGKASDGLSLVFSVTTLALVSTQNNNSTSWEAAVISILAIVFVIISIYVTPIKRAKQYLEAWRECDKNIMMLYTIDAEKKTIICEEKNINLNEFIAYCAKSLSEGEKNLTTDTE